MRPAVEFTASDLAVAVVVLLALLWMWRAGARATRASDAATRGGVRLVSLAGRVALAATVIVVVQWVVIAKVADRWALLVVLGLPALFAAYTLTRALTITAVDLDGSRPRRRR